MANVVKRQKIGMGEDQKEFDVEWDLIANPPRSNIKCRSFRRVAYAVIAGPENILLQYASDIESCITIAVRDIGLSVIMQDPVAAGKTLKGLALVNCLGHIIGDDYASLAITVSILVEADDWQQC